MDAPPAAPPVRFNRLLPYWAVLRTDVRQTARSWVYRLWVLTAVAAAGGSVAYKAGVHREAGIVQAASAEAGNLVRGLAAGSLALIALLAVGGVSGERATVADAVLCRGISRRQYFLAKWHARLASVLGTAGALTAGVLAAHHALFDPDLTLAGGLAAVGLVAAGLAVVVSWGVTVGAMSTSTVTGVTLFWLLLTGGLFLASLLPDPYPTPDRVLGRLRFVVRGEYDPALLVQAGAAAAGLSGLAAAVGLVGFGRKDV